MRRAALVLCLLPLPLWAQGTDDDGEGFLTELIEDSLSGVSRTIDIVGFQGALSSRATVERLTIADSEGIWLEAEDLSLEWDRGALLSGRLEIATLRAGRIALPRAPVPEPGVDLPTAEATPFALPDLPVSISIGTLGADRIELGRALVGEDIIARLDASGTLDGGTGQARIVAERIDGSEGRFEIAAAYDNATGNLTLDTTLAEEAGGLVPRSLGLPGAPSVRFDLDGSGPLDGFSGELAIATEGIDRVAGTFGSGTDGSETTYTLDISGDVTTLFAPQYRPFFGEDLRLKVVAQQAEDGSVTLDALDLEAEAVRLAGSAAIGPDGWPARLALNGRIGTAAGPTLLPLGGAETRVDAVALSVRYDGAADDGWEGRFDIEGLMRDGLAVPALTLTGAGEIIPGDGAALGRLTANLDYGASGVTLSDPALSAAIPPDISGELVLIHEEGAPLQLPRLTLQGDDLALEATAEFDGADIALAVESRAGDFTRFAPLAGLDLRGSGVVRVAGNVRPLDGISDLLLTAETTDLALGISEVDPLLAGTGRVALAAERDTEGLRITGLTVRTDQAALNGNATISSNVQAGALTGELGDIASLIPGLGGRASLEATARREVDGQALASVALDLPTGRLVADVEQAADEPVLARIEATLSDLAPYAAALNLQASGAADLEITARHDLETRATSVTLSGETRDLTTPLAELTPVLAGRGTLTVSARGTLRDSPTLDDLSEIDLDLAYPAATLDLSARQSNDAILGEGSAGLPRLAAFSGLAGRPLRGGADLSFGGGFDRTSGVARVTLDARTQELAGLHPGVDPLLAGQGDLSLTARGRIDEAPDLGDLQALGLSLSTAAIDAELDANADGGLIRTTASASLPRLAALATLAGRRLSGSADLDLTGTLDPEARTIDTRLTLATTNLGLGIPAADPLTAGSGTVSGRLIAKSSGEFQLVGAEIAYPNLTVSADAESDGRTGGGSYSARLRDVGLFTDALSGPLSASGTAAQHSNGWQIDTAVDGPGGANARVSGTVGATLGLGLTGQLPLALLNGVLDPRRLSGTATLDLRADGPPTLGSLTGTVGIAGARLSAPTLVQTLEDIGGTIALGGGAANLNIAGRVPQGGGLTLSGPIRLAAPYSADLAIGIAGIVLRDPTLYETSANGALTVTGPLTGGATIRGTVALGQTELQVPSSTVGALGSPPPVSHVGASPAVRQTLDRAGLSVTGRTVARPGGPAFPLDITVSAPGRIFIRGRGLDAELGGTLRLSGTTADIVPSGQFDLIRGRLDILQKRFDLTEGLARLAGRFDPFLRLVARTETGDGTVIEIIIDGLASAPDLRFASSPELPEDEVLARLLFGRSVSEISPLQAVQLAGAVSTLAGRGGGGIANQFREGLNLDNFDLTTDEAGNAAVSAGRYLSENVYTEITVDSDGETEIDLNIDLSDSLTARGSVGADGETSVGIFFERDY